MEHGSQSRHRHRKQRDRKKEQAIRPFLLDFSLGLALEVGITLLGLTAGSFLFYYGIWAGSETEYRIVAGAILLAAVGISSVWWLRTQRGYRKLGIFGVTAVYFFLRLILAGFGQIG